MESQKYILFILQEGNTQSRSLLVPYDKFLCVENRKQDYEILKKHAKKYIYKKNGTHDTINNVIFINYSADDETCKIWSQDSTEYTKIINDISFYADWSYNFSDSEYGHRLTNVNDEIWVDDIYKDFCSGFNHIETYLTCQAMTEIENKQIDIVDSFLILQTYGNVYKFPLYDTVDEMLQDMYGFKLSNIK